METDPDGTQILMQLFILVLLTLVNAFFAGAEMAVVSVNKNRVKVLAEEGNKKALLIQSLFEDSTKFLSTDRTAKSGGFLFFYGTADLYGFKNIIAVY